MIDLLIGQFLALEFFLETVSTAWELFLQNVPKWNENWYWEFMSMFDDSAENRDIRNMINEKFDEELSKRLSLVRILGRFLTAVWNLLMLK